MLPLTKHNRKQIGRNTHSIEDINDRDNPVFRRVSKPAIATGGGEEIRRAKVTQNAPDENIITANLYNRSTGVLDTGVSIDVYCNISNGTALDEAGPRLILGNDISIYQSVFVSGETTETRWVCSTNFDTDENCVCNTP